MFGDKNDKLKNQNKCLVSNLNVLATLACVNRGGIGNNQSLTKMGSGNVISIL
jgi:hypothetical protein